MVDQSTICCQGNITIDSALWSEVLSVSLEGQISNDPHPSKRRKFEPSSASPTNASDLVQLIDRELCLKFSHKESQAKLLSACSGDISNLIVEADVIVQQEGVRSISFRLYPRNDSRTMIEFKVDEASLTLDARQDIEWVDEVRKARTTPIKKSKSKAISQRLEEFNYTSQLCFHRRDATQWDIILKLGVTALCANEWTERSLSLSNQKWWQLFAHAFPYGPKIEGAKNIAPRDFYTSVHVPAHDIAVPDAVQHSTLDCTLLPFQRRAVRWLLQKEGSDLVNGSNELVDYSKADTDDIPPTFFEVKDKRDRTCYVSHIRGIVSRNLKAIQRETDYTRGGLLCEEMGLGKTVELIALICLHRRQNICESVYDEDKKKNLKPTGATLIITPASILQQWQNELEMHAPGLKVFTYRGVKAYKNKEMPEMVAELAKYDVVLTTYSVLSSEIHYAQPLSGRELRHEKIYIPKRSPLVDISWWRVCLDEAQMIESSVCASAIVAREIPRINAWAVSGTPLRKDTDDLWGLFLFLRYEPFCSIDVWRRCIKFNHLAFKSLCKDMSIRHSKDIVRHEISLPVQKRVVVTVPFSPVEEQNYQHIFAMMCEDCGLDQSGAPLTNDWDPERYAERMRVWLTRLRQTCLHPEAGERNRKAFGSNKGPLRTVEEVLDVMIDQQLVSMREDERTLFTSMIKRGVIYEHNKNIEAALDIWVTAFERVRAVIAECREALEEELKQIRARSIISKAEKSKDKRANEYESDEDEEDEDEDGSESKSTRLGVLRNRLRSFLDIEHSCVFWIATAYFQLLEKEESKGKINKDGEVAPGETDQTKVKHYTEKQDEYYGRAKHIRLELMQATRSRALEYIKKLKKKSATQDFTEVPDIEPPAENSGGIESRTILDGITDLANKLNEQVIVLDEWRENLIQLLMETLVDADEEDQELKGDELEVSVEKQEQSFAYLSALRALVADREEALTGIKSTLVEDETRKALERQGKIHEVVFRKLIAIKDSVKPKDSKEKSMKRHIAEMRTLINNLKQQEEAGNKRASLERKLAESELRKISKAEKVQSKACADLTREVEWLRGATNSRLEFYRQLQVVSDSVEGLNEEERGQLFDDFFFERMIQDELKLDQKVTKSKSKSRYLQHLKGEKVEDRPNCGICLSSYEIGVLLSCGHAFCKECMMMWWKQSHLCPQCKLHLRLDDINQITFKPAEMTIQHEQSAPSTPEKNPSSPKIYANVDDLVLQQIKNIDVGLSFGTKIDMITRHLIWLKQNEPGFKAVIFSQWSDVLEVIKMSLRKSEIGFASLENREGIDHFRNDPDISCFLLHAKSQSAGLTLVNATHVFLCEPLINIALELQAISRVHRIGQKHVTTVWLYVVSGTVEQSVLELATQNRLALIGKDENNISTSRSHSVEPDGVRTPTEWNQKLDAAESSQLRENLNKYIDKSIGGGEMVDKEHLWDCLFRARSHSMHDAANDEAVRREIMAGAAEARIRSNGIGVPGSSRDA